jgi:hypothetical protein
MPRAPLSVALTPSQRRHGLDLEGCVSQPMPTARSTPRVAVGVALPTPRASLRRRLSWRASLAWPGHPPTVPTFGLRLIIKGDPSLIIKAIH